MRSTSVLAEGTLFVEPESIDIPAHICDFEDNTYAMLAMHARIAFDIDRRLLLRRGT